MIEIPTQSVDGYIGEIENFCSDKKLSGRSLEEVVVTIKARFEPDQARIVEMIEIAIVKIATPKCPFPREVAQAIFTKFELPKITDDMASETEMLESASS